MTTAKTTANGHILTTWQWISVIIVIIGGTVGLDQRMQSTVRVFADANDRDHTVIRAELQDISRSIPPQWFRDEVAQNKRLIEELENDLDNLRIAVTELASFTKRITNGGSQ